MKLSSVILSSILALYTAVNGKPITDDSIETNESANYINKINIEPLIPLIPELPTIPIEPLKQCPLSLGNVIVQNLLCNIRGGKFYQKFNEYPNCNYDYVCFIPSENSSILSRCIIIDDKEYCSADISNINACKLSGDSYSFADCVKEADEYFPDFEYRYTLLPITIPPPIYIPPINIPPIDIPPNLPILTFPGTIEPFKPTETIEPHLPTGLIFEPIRTSIPVPIVRPTSVPMEEIPVNELYKRAIETTVPVPTKTIKKPGQSTMDEVEYPLHLIDLIKTDIIIEPTLTNIKPYKPTAIPVPIVRPTPVPMDKDIPTVKNIPAAKEIPLPKELIKQIIKTPIPMPSRTIKRPDQFTKINPTLIETGIKIEPPFTNIRPFKPTAIPIPTVRPTLVPMRKDVPQVNDIKGSVPPATAQSNDNSAGSRIRIDIVGNVTIDGVFYMQNFTDTDVYTPDVYIGNGGDFPGFYEGDTSVKFYTAKENSDVIIVVFVDGSQLNLYKKDITNI